MNLLEKIKWKVKKMQKKLTKILEKAKEQIENVSSVQEAEEIRIARSYPASHA